MAVAMALLWGGCLFSVGLINLFAPTYGAVFLDVMSSVYPGFHVAHTFGNVIIGTLEGFVDGALAGAFLALLYNWLTPGIGAPRGHAEA